MDASGACESDIIGERLARIQDRIALAARGAGRKPEEIDILAVTKGQPPATVRAAFVAGLRSFGENYAQEAVDKQRALGDLSGAAWHFIGHLQSNKAALAAGRFALIQSIDSERLARRLDQAAEGALAIQDVLVQVHLGDEATKSGVGPKEAPALCEEIIRLPHLRLKGLMGIAPLVGDDGARVDTRPYFAGLRKLFEELPSKNRQVLSMGMSADFEAAIAEGATLVRIGSALLGERPAR